MTGVGTHLLVDLLNCNPELLKKVDYIDEIMFQACKVARATVVGKYFKQFDPYGVSGVVVIAESHFTIHTWPEHGIAAVDFFSCTDSVDMQGAIDYLKEKLEATDSISTLLSRGNMKLSRVYNVKVEEETANEISIWNVSKYL